MSGNRNPLMPEDHHATLEEVVAHLSKPENRIGGAVDAENNTNNPFTSLPKDVQVYLRWKLDSVSFFALSRTSKSHRALLDRSVEAKQAYDAARDELRRLLSHGALGELEDAEHIWRAFPDLLTCRGTVYHPNRIYVEGQAPVDIPFHQNPGRYKYVGRTFYQILLMNSEFKEAEKVGKLMTQEEKQKQFDEVFPAGEIKKYNFDLEEAKRLLQILFDAVAKDKSLKIERDQDANAKNIIIMNNATGEALYKLYAYAKPKSEHDTGLVFDPEFYHEALKLYDEKNGQFKQICGRYLFWNICVEEWLAGCLGTRFLRPHAQGLNTPLTRRGCILEDGSSIFAFRRAVDSIPGSHIFVGYNGMVGSKFGSGEYRGWWEVFGAHVKQQREQGQTLCGSIRLQNRRGV